MRIRRIITTAAIAAVTCATLSSTVAPAQADDANYDKASCAGVALDGDEQAAVPMMSLLAEQNVPLTGLAGHVRQASYQSPDGYRCDLVWLHVPAAADRQKVTANVSWKGDFLVTDGQGYEYLRTDAKGFWNGTQVPTTTMTYGGIDYRAGIHLLAADVYDQVTTYVSYGTTFTDTAQPLKWTVEVTAHAGSKTTTTPASADVVTAATTVRNTAVADADKVFAKAKSKAKKALKKALKAANTKKARKAAKKKYAKRVAAAKQQADARKATAEQVYQAAIAPVVNTVTFAAAVNPPLSGQVPPLV